MGVYLCVSAMNFPGTLLSEDAKKTLAVVVKAFFVMVPIVHLCLK